MNIAGVFFVIIALFMLFDAAGMVYFLSVRDWNYFIMSFIIMLMILFIISMTDATARGLI